MCQKRHVTLQLVTLICYRKYNRKEISYALEPIYKWDRLIPSIGLSKKIFNKTFLFFSQLLFAIKGLIRMQKSF
jgi:hypothetical protein